MMTVADVIDKYGYLMDEEQLRSMQNIHPARLTLQYLLNGMQNDGSYYDASKSHKWNTEAPGIDYRRLMSNSGK